MRNNNCDLKNDIRILRGWTDDEQEELEWEKRNHESILDTYDSVLNQEGTALNTKYVNTDSNAEEQQLAEDIFDFWQGRAVFPAPKYVYRYARVKDSEGQDLYVQNFIYTTDIRETHTYPAIETTNCKDKATSFTEDEFKYDLMHNDLGNFKDFIGSKVKVA